MCIFSFGHRLDLGKLRHLPRPHTAQDWGKQETLKQRCNPTEQRYPDHKENKSFRRGAGRPQRGLRGHTGVQQTRAAARGASVCRDKLLLGDVVCRAASGVVSLPCLPLDPDWEAGGGDDYRQGRVRTDQRCGIPKVQPGPGWPHPDQHWPQAARGLQGLGRAPGGQVACPGSPAGL